MDEQTLKPDPKRSELHQTRSGAKVVRLDAGDHHLGDLLRLHRAGRLRARRHRDQARSGAITVGIVLGVAIILASILLTGIYVIRANAITTN